MRKIYEGLGILLKYEPDGSCAAEHDELYADGPEPDAMASEDFVALSALGWQHFRDFGWRRFT